ncbi:uncharacterized protein DUF4360 [Actinomadura pelletieri DSM 43383]|uniref:Uncharacterized protein DUF4360 n=1 Tax=Actinomadura pelletieri DSM 43383 TaxID=1120940 RepID=A0A495QY22_9ACTN|nr:DUF4360 domain-containing protein [Actinomadura pelletieri]RKS79105.1 uncharacterized protein DUF4360 [Actinomadura pelletieri DSM 43383]
MRAGLAISATVVLGVAVTVASAVPAVAGSRVVPGPDGARVEVATASGTGCSLGSVYAGLSEDADLMYLNNSVSAQAGAGSSPSQSRRYCQVSLRMTVPEGFTYGIVSSTYRGYAQIQEGARAIVNANHSFSSGSAFFRHAVLGPIDGPWEFTGRWPNDEILWKQCDDLRNFETRSELSVELGSSDRSKLSSISIGEGTGLANHDYQLAWKTCP